MDHNIEITTPTGLPPGAGFDRNTLNIRIKNNIGWDAKIKRIDFDTGQFENYDLGPPPNDGILFPSHAITKSTDEISVIDDIALGTLWDTGTVYEIEFVITIENTESELPHKYNGIIKGKVT